MLRGGEGTDQALAQAGADARRGIDQGGGVRRRSTAGAAVRRQEVVARMVRAAATLAAGRSSSHGEDLSSGAATRNSSLPNPSCGRVAHQGEGEGRATTMTQA